MTLIDVMKTKVDNHGPCMSISSVFGAFALGFAIMSPPVNAVAGNNPEPSVANEAAPARPGYIAELEELEAARAQGTVAAYDLFLARHPDSRYAEQAIQERKALTTGEK